MISPNLYRNRVERHLAEHHCYSMQRQGHSMRGCNRKSRPQFGYYSAGAKIVILYPSNRQYKFQLKFRMLTFHSLSALPIIARCFLISSRFCLRLVRLLRRVPVTSTVWTLICSRVFLTTRLTISGDNESVAANVAGVFECDNGDNGVDDDNCVGVQSIDESGVRRD